MRQEIKTGLVIIVTIIILFIVKAGAILTLLKVITISALFGQAIIIIECLR